MSVSLRKSPVLVVRQGAHGKWSAYDGTARVAGFYSTRDEAVKGGLRHIRRVMAG